MGLALRILYLDVWVGTNEKLSSETGRFRLSDLTTYATIHHHWLLRSWDFSRVSKVN
ncbi:hypothetical protein VTP01DRAFT_3653 [Rhizomucor pusillus]|uniref:uncharacterized protein n=1 Tax=Rhizomucor pusillus TaxID=4840 RepID=UPI00374441CD